MPAENEVQPGTTTATPAITAAASPAGAQNTDTSGDKMIPIERFNEINNQLKTLKDQMTAKEQAEQAAEQNRLKEQQRWQELAQKHEGELSQLKPQLEQRGQQLERYEKSLQTMLKAQLATVPDHLQSLLTKLDPVEQLEWLAANGDKLKAPAAQGVPATPRPAGNLGNAQQEKLQEQQKRLVASNF